MKEKLPTPEDLLSKAEQEQKLEEAPQDFSEVFGPYIKELQERVDKEREVENRSGETIDTLKEEVEKEFEFPNSK